MNRLRPEDYTYHVRWSPQDERWVCRVTEFPTLRAQSRSAGGATTAAHENMEMVLHAIYARGDSPPMPIPEPK